MKLRSKAGLIPLLLAVGISQTQGSLAQDQENEEASSAILFGDPQQNTGLTRDQCAPLGMVDGEIWKVPRYGKQTRATLQSLTLTNAPALLEQDPYITNTIPHRNEDGYCAILLSQDDPTTYTLIDYESEQAAVDARAVITHEGSCGSCSSLQDLVIYMSEPALTEPARECGIRGYFRGEQAGIECMQDIGFSQACAQIWYFNARNTRTQCLIECLEHLEEPNHDQDMSPNVCISCDEEISGPIFKAFAGRTRRNSGLPSGICREQESVYWLEHNSYIQTTPE